MAVTTGMLAIRDRLGEVHTVIVYLLVVLGVSAWLRRFEAIVTAVLTFLCFNLFFLRPYLTLLLDDPLDSLVLIGYLVTAAVAAQLLHLSRAQADQARLRASEIERLSALGAETVSVGRAEDALAAIANVIRTTLDAGRCEVYLKDASDPQPKRIALSPHLHLDEEDQLPETVSWVATHGIAAAELAGGITRQQEEPGKPLRFEKGTVSVMYPLRIRDRTVGVLRLVGRREPSQPSAAEERFLDVLSFYAALGVERVRLWAQAEQAAALAEADRLKDSLIATVSHDLRTPLTSIKALASEIAAEGDERARVIESEADRLNMLVADLLDLSRIQAGQLKLDVQVNSADDLVGSVLRDLVTTLKDRTVEVRLEQSPETLVGLFDFVQSLRILSNLVENAHKYSPPDAPIDITVRRDDDRLIFAISDRGPGIANTERDLIYRPFYRGSKVNGIPGSGLGLAIACRLAELQEGVICHMARPGGGTSFTYRLPAARPPI